MGKFSNNLNKKFAMKNQEKAQNKQNEKYFNQAYRPETEVKLTGEEFMIIQRITQDLLRNRIHIVNVSVDGVIHKGQSLAPNDWDVYDFSEYVAQLHRKNIDSGLTVPVDVLRKELEAEAKKEKEQKPTLTVEPLVEEKVQQEEEAVVVETPQEESAPKKINFKDKE